MWWFLDLHRWNSNHNAKMVKILISSFTWMNLIVSLKYYINKVVICCWIEHWKCDDIYDTRERREGEMKLHLIIDEHWKARVFLFTRNNWISVSKRPFPFRWGKNNLNQSITSNGQTYYYAKPNFFSSSIKLHWKKHYSKFLKMIF